MQNGATNTTDEAGGEMITGALCVCVCVCVCVEPHWQASSFIYKDVRNTEPRMSTRYMRGRGEGGKEGGREMGGAGGPE